MRYFGCISYNGTPYHGWQKQLNTDMSVQGKIEKVLTTLLRQDILTTGCGRTDTGVHAKKFYFHFDFDGSVFWKDIIYHANKMLDSTIVIHSMYLVPDQLHARFDATERSYTYKISQRKDPFEYFSYYYPYISEKDIDTLNDIAKIILQSTVFTQYCKSNADNETDLCTIKSSYWTYDKHTETYEYHITANRFLRGMIRLLVGMMLNVARGKLSMEEITLSLQENKSLTTPWSVPAIGLTLHDIKYEIEFTGLKTNPLFTE
jgi:tRNA pseudouridine38-40 synthase